VDAGAVRRVLGLVEEERYLELLDVLADGRHAEVFTLVERLLDEGYDLAEFYHGLMDALRAVLRLRLAPDAPLDLREDLRAAFAARAERFAPGDLVRMLAAAADLETSGSMRRSANPRVLVEMLLLRLSYLDRTVDIEELLRAMGGAPAPRGGAATPPAGPGQAAKKGGKGAATSARRPGPEEVGPSSSLAEAWARWLESGRGVPRGLSAFLRSSSVKEVGDGLEISPPPGPAMERLQDQGVLEEIRAGLLPWAGHSVAVRVAPVEAPGSTPARIGRDEVRADTLKALYRKEPRLERAVEELDLELME